MRLSRATFLPCILILAASTLAAQGRPMRSGFGMSIGAGVGSASVTCDDCPDADRLNGISGYLRLGGYINPRLFIGAEGSGWVKNSEGFDRRIATLTVALVGYPSETAGFFVRSGIGTIGAVLESPLVLVEAWWGITWQVGLGWDIPMGQSVALTPYVTYINSTETAVYIDGISIGYNINPNVLQAGLAITVH